MAKQFNPITAKLLGYSSTGLGILAIVVGLTLFISRPDYPNIKTVLFILLSVGIVDIGLGIVFIYTAWLATRYYQRPVDNETETGQDTEPTAEPDTKLETETDDRQL